MKCLYIKMTGRNEKCPCGSGLKFKNCCIDKIQTSKINKSILDEILESPNPYLKEVQTFIIENQFYGKKDPTFYNQIALMLGSSNNFKEAIPFHKKAISLDSKTDVFRLNYAVSLSSIGNHKEAIKIVDKIPDDEDRKLVIEANIKRQILPFKDIYKIYEKAIDQDPSFYLPYLNIVDGMEDCETRDYWIEKSYNKFPTHPEIVFNWVIKSFRNHDYEKIASDDWYAILKNYGDDISIVNKKEDISELLEFLEYCKTLAKILFMFNGIEQEIDLEKYDNQIKNLVKYFIRSNHSNCLIYIKVLDIVQNYALLESLKQTYDCLCDDCKNKLDYDHIKFNTLRNLDVYKSKTLELGEKIIKSDSGLKSIDFLLNYISFLDDKIGSNEAIQKLKEVIDNEFDYKVEYIIRLYWDLAIISCTSGNWMLAKDNFVKFKNLDFFDNLEQISNPSLKNFYLSSISNFSWVDYNIYICDLALKNLVNPKKINFLTWVDENLKDMDINASDFSELNIFIEDIFGWCIKNKNDKFYLNNFSNKIKNSPFENLYGKINTQKENLTISMIMKNQSDKKVSTKIANNISLMQHHLIDEGDFSGIFNDLCNAIPQFRLLPEVSCNSLIEAESRRNDKGVYDYAPSIVAYSKALEILIRERIFKKFSIEFKKIKDYSSIIEEAKSDKNSKQFYGLIKFIKNGFLELGTLSQILKLLQGKTIKRVVLLQTLYQFLNTYYPVILENRFLNDILLLSQSKRNLATHELSFSKDENEDVRSLVIGLINSLLKIKLI